MGILEADEQVRQMWRGAFVVVTLSSMVLAFQEHQPAVQTLGSSEMEALQLGEPQVDTYQKMSGLHFSEASQDMSVDDRGGCERQCNDRAAGCKSYSYNAKTKGCTLSADSMLFDPNAALGVKTKENGYFKVPGLAYFKDEEWLGVNSNVAHSEAACTQFCDKANDCKAFKFVKESGYCALTGKSIGIGPDWTYYGKEEQPAAKATPPTSQPNAPKSGTDKSGDVVKQADLKANIEDESKKLQEALADVANAKEEARQDLINSEKDDQGLQVMKARLSAAKDGAKEQVLESEKAGKLDSELVKQKARAQMEKMQLEQTVKEHADKVKKIKEAATEKANEALAEVDNNKKAIEKQSAIQFQSQKLKQDIAVAAHNASISEQEALLDDSLLANAEKRSQDRIRRIDEMMSAKIKTDAEVVEASKLSAAEALEAAEKRNKEGIARAVAQVSSGTNVNRTKQLAIFEAAANTRALKQQENTTAIEANNTRLKLKEQKEKAELLAIRLTLQQKEAELLIYTKTVVRTALKVPKAKEDEEPQHQQTSDQLALSIMEAKRKKVREAAFAAEEEASVRANRLVREAEAKLEANQKEIKKKAAVKAEADRRAELKQLHLHYQKRAADQLSKIKEREADVADHKAAVQNCTVTRKTGLAELKKVAADLATVKDELQATKTLEAAKEKFRQSVRGACDAIPVLEAEEISLLLHPLTSRQLSFTKSQANEAAALKAADKAVAAALNEANEAVSAAAAKQQATAAKAKTTADEQARIVEVAKETQQEASNKAATATDPAEKEEAEAVLAKADKAVSAAAAKQQATAAEAKTAAVEQARIVEVAKEAQQEAGKKAAMRMRKLPADEKAAAIAAVAAMKKRKLKPKGIKKRCIAGTYGKANYVEMTLAKAKAACTSRGLVVCKKSCKNAGCWYNKGYVWTDIPCEDEQTKEAGVLALSGISEVPSQGVCITSASAVTARGKKISAQCCTASGECQRRSVKMPAEGKTYADVKGTMAAGSTCGARIKWVEDNKGMTKKDAQNFVGDEF